MRELSVVEQRYQAVLAVISDGETVTEVAARFGVRRQTVHEWLAKYEAEPPRRVWRVLSLEGSSPWRVPRSTPPSCVSVRFGWLWSPGPITRASTRRSA